MAKYDEWLTPDGLLQLEAWARDGLTYEQIASNCGIALSTLKDWRKRFSAISTALKKGASPAHARGNTDNFFTLG